MGCWDCSCIICGLPPHNYAVGEKYKSISNWMNKCTLLTLDNKVHRNLRELTCNIGFGDKNTIPYVNNIEYDVSEHVDRGDITSKNGLFLHDDCYKYIGVKIKYSNVSHIKIKYGSPVNSKIYGLKDYNKGQFFNFEKLNDKNSFIIESPLKSEKNGKRLDKIISFYNISNRPIPPKSVEKNSIIYEKNKLYSNSSGKWNVIEDNVEIKKLVVPKYKKLSNRFFNMLYYEGEILDKKDSGIFIIKNSSKTDRNGTYLNMDMKLIGTKTAFKKLEKELGYKIN